MCWTCNVFGNDQFNEAGKWLKSKMLPDGLVKVDYEHYFPVFNRHYTDKPTFILICELGDSEGICEGRSTWRHELEWVG